MRRKALTAFNSAELFNSAMVYFNHLRKFGIFESYQITDRKITAGPVFNVSIRSDDLEYFETNQTTCLRDINLMNWNIFYPVWINMKLSQNKTG